jgi:multicomponent Na+:H+ antiporter subunit G
MVETIVHGLSWFCLMSGSAFCIIGAIGVLRLPDFYSRIHGAGITDTLGAGLIMMGLMLQGGFTIVTVKLVMILVFLDCMGPTATHALVKAAYAKGIKVDDPEVGDAPSH